MNKNIGIIINRTSMNQLAYESIYTINKEILTGSEYDYRIFFENLDATCISPMCSVMNISEMYAYDGLIISTTLENSKMSLKTIGDIHRAFLIWDLEFIRNEKNFLDNIRVYRDPRLFLIARSEDAAKAVENYCNRKVNMIMPTLSFSRIKDELTRNK